MKNILYFVVLSLLTLSCEKKTETKNEILPTKKVAVVSFSDFKKELGLKSEEEKSKYFFTYISHDVPKYWEGTGWDFNGTTRIPKEGSLACGYFVTNILSDYGFQIDRVKLAQQASSVMIKKLCIDINYFTSVEDLEKFVLKKEENQIYIVGLDFHTGFIIRDKNDVYFLHSNYIKNKGVTKEIAKTSTALNQSKTFMVGNLKFK